ncbi:hypothetical protein RI367_005882 [Sorochytrium milnesiophthora]
MRSDIVLEPLIDKGTAENKSTNSSPTRHASASTSPHSTGSPNRSPPGNSLGNLFGPETGDDLSAPKDIPKRVKQARFVIQLFFFVLKSLMHWAIGASLLLLPGGYGYYLLQPDDPPLLPGNPEPIVLSVDLIRWSCWGLTTWTAGWFAAFVVANSRRFSLRTLRVDSSIQMRKYDMYLCTCVSFVTACGLFPVFFPIFNSPWHYYDYCFHVLCSLLVGSIMALVQKLLIHIISDNFFKTAYAERDEKQTFATLLDATKHFVEEERSDKPGPSTEAKPVRHTRNISWSLKNLSHPDKSHEAAAAKSTEQLSGQGEESQRTTQAFHFPQQQQQHQQHPHGSYLKYLFAAKVEDEYSSESAARTARRLFAALSNGRTHLHMGDFADHFRTPADTKRVFELFDIEGNGNITKRELRDALVGLYKEKKHLIQSKSDLVKVCRKLDRIFWCFTLLMWSLCVIVIWGGSLSSTLVPLGSFLLALSFAFGSTAKSLFESLVFIFGTHPYDVGDRVFIENVSLIVKEIGILTTTFRRSDGTLAYFPNSSLLTKPIFNAHRSGPTMDFIEVQIDFYTPNAKLEQLRARLNSFTSSEREFSPTLHLHINEIENTNRLRILMWLEHKSNWQDMVKRWNRRTKFMIELKSALTDLKIRYSLPLQNTEFWQPQSFDPERLAALPDPNKSATAPAYGDLNTHRGSITADRMPAFLPTRQQ